MTDIPERMPMPDQSHFHEECGVFGMFSPNRRALSGPVYYGLTALSHMIRLQVPILTVGIPAVLSLYFDLFSDFMQAFIFIMLTMVFISNAGPSDDAAET